MPTTVNVYNISDLSHDESPKEVFINASENIQIHIRQVGDKAVIWLPYGNEFDFVGNMITIHKG